MPTRVWTDSSAAMGICGRQGLGKLRHIECHTLWVQQRLRQKEFELRKVRGDVNPADLFTKFMESRVKIDQLIGLFGCEFREGRAASAPLLRREGLQEFSSADLGQDMGSEDNEAYTLGEAGMHDPDVLPHMYSRQDMARLFPVIEPCANIGFGEDDPSGLEAELLDPINTPFGPQVHRPHRPLQPPESFSDNDDDNMAGRR